MSNFIYGKAKESLLKGEINLVLNQLKVLLIDNSLYTPQQNVHQFVSDVPSNAIKKRSNALENVTLTLGVLDASDLLIPDYDGSAFNAVIGYQSNISDTSARLIFYIDNALGLPFSGSSSTSPVTIVWENNSTKIISL